jgi:hypothetical protein
MNHSISSSIKHNSKAKSVLLELEKIHDPIIDQFISSIPLDLSTAANRLNKNYQLDELTIKNRALLKRYIFNFHNQAQTATKSVDVGLNMLSGNDTDLLVAIHQPNLFAYGGVFKKLILLKELKAAIYKSNPKKQIVTMFIIVDHDFIGDHWTKVAQLPNARSYDGIMEIRFPVKMKKRWQMTHKNAPPTQSMLNFWKHEVKLWIKDTTKAIGIDRGPYLDNLNSFWQFVDKSLSRAKSYADFNSFLISNIVNISWHDDTLFVRLSDIPEVFVNGMNFLIKNFEQYSASLKETENIFKMSGITTGMSPNAHLFAPNWLHCICGSKASGTFKKEGASFICQGSCISCKRDISTNFGTLTDQHFVEKLFEISPRAIPILLLLSMDLRCSGIVLGTGGSLRYTIVASRTFDRFKIPMPIPIIWASEDEYHGIAQREALLSSVNTQIQSIDQLNALHNELSIDRSSIVPLIRERKERFERNLSIDSILQEIQKIKQRQRKTRESIRMATRSLNMLQMKPSIIDYAVNFGIEKVGPLWSKNLVTNNDLFIPTTPLEA